MRPTSLLAIVVLLAATLAIALFWSGRGSPPLSVGTGDASRASGAVPPARAVEVGPPSGRDAPEVAATLEGAGDARAARVPVDAVGAPPGNFRLGGTVTLRRRVDDRWEFERELDGRLILRATSVVWEGVGDATARPHEFEVAVEAGRIQVEFELAAEVGAATLDVLEGELDGAPVYGITGAVELVRGAPVEAWGILVARGTTATVRVVDRESGQPLDRAVIVRGEGRVVPADRHPGLADLRPLAGPSRSPLELSTTWSVARGAELRDTLGFLVGAEGYAWEWIPSLVALRSPSTASGGDRVDPEPRTVALGPGGALRVVVEDPAERGLPLVLHVHDDPDLSGPPVIQHPFEGALDARFEGVPIADLRVRTGDGRRWRKMPPVDEAEVRSRAGETVEAQLAVPEVDPADLRSFDARIVLRSSGWPPDWTFEDLGLRLVEGGDGSFGYERLDFGPRTELSGGAFEVASQPFRLGAGRYVLEGPWLGRRRELTIDQPGDQVVELGPLCSLRVDLVDDATGAPLPEFTLHVGPRPFGGRIQLVGTEEYVQQVGGGFGHAAGIKAGRYPDAPASFYVWGAAGPTELRVRLPLGAERVDPDGVRWIPGLYAERTVELTPDSDRVELRLHRGLSLVVRLTAGARGLGFPLTRPLDDVVALDGPGTVTRVERWGEAAVLRVDRAGDFSLRVEPPDGYLAPDPIPVSIAVDQPVELEVPLTRDG